MSDIYARHSVVSADSRLLVVSSLLLCCNMQIIPSYLYANETIFWPKATNTRREREREKGVEKEGAETINMAKLATRRWSADYSTG